MRLAVFLGIAASGAVAATAALSSVAASAQKVVLTGMPLYHPAQLPSGELTTFTVTCPPGYNATSSGVSTPAPGVRALRSTPVPPRAWQFKFINPVGNPAAQVTVVVICSKPGLPLWLVIKPLKIKSPYKVKTVTPPAVVPAPGERKEVRADCPNGTTPGGYGYDQDPDRAKRLPGHEPIPPQLNLSAVITEAIPDARGWTFTVQNFSPAQPTSPAPTFLTVVCIPRSLVVGNKRMSATIKLHSSVARSTDEAAPGPNHFTHSCPNGAPALGAGFSFPGGRRLSADGVAPLWHPGGAWWIYSVEAATVAVVTYLVCGATYAH